MADIKFVENDGKLQIFTPYNAEFVKQIKTIGGARWDSKNRCWTVDPDLANSIKEICRNIYGDDGSTPVEKVKIRVTFLINVYGHCSAVTRFGKTISRAWGRDSGAVSGDDVAFVTGKPSSGGSVKNWKSVIDAGSVVVITNVPKQLIDDYDRDEMKVEVIDQSADDKKSALIAEKEKLRTRLAEIEKELETIHKRRPENATGEGEKNEKDNQW